MSTRADGPYTGVENLEVMAEARNYNTWLADLVVRNLGDGREYVDFGAGSGTFALMLADRGHIIRCVEPDAALSMRLLEAGLQAVDSVDALDPISHLYSLNVLEHIEDDFGAAQKIFSRMEPGGTVFVYVPAFQVLYTTMDAKVGHYRRYSKQRLTEVFRQAGFVVDDVRFADSLGFFATLLFKWLGNRDGRLNRRSLLIYDRYVFPVSRLLDLLVSAFIGKNLMIRAHRP